MQKYDKLHFDSNKIDGYNKTFNYIISPREDGKSTWFWVTKFWKAFQQGYTTLVLRRTIRDCTQAYVESIRFILEKFCQEKVEFQYHSSELAEGICYIYIDDRPAFVVLAMWLPLERFKSNVIPKLKYIFFDEFIVNTRDGEKYLPNEAFKLKEIYNTFYREGDADKPTKVYCCGNPYSLYIPLIDGYGIDLNKLIQKGTFTGSNWLIDYHDIKPELRDFILQKNPLYQFSDDYFKYAFEGRAVNDEKIWISKEIPTNMSLAFVLVLGHTSLVVYQGEGQDGQMFHVERTSKDEGKRRQRFAIDLSSVQSGVNLLTYEEKRTTQYMKIALFRGQVSFSDVGAYYLLEEIAGKI